MIFYLQLVRLLLDHGAHLDQPNRAGDCPMQLIAINPMSTIPLVNYISLRCLAATAIVKNQIPYIGEVPSTLQEFVGFHEE